MNLQDIKLIFAIILDREHPTEIIIQKKPEWPDTPQGITKHVNDLERRVQNLIRDEPKKMELLNMGKTDFLNN